MQEPGGQHSLAVLQPLWDTSEAAPCSGIDLVTCLYTVSLIVEAPWCVGLTNCVETSASRPLHRSEPTHHSEGFRCPLQVFGTGHQQIWEWRPHLNHGIFFVSLLRQAAYSSGFHSFIFHHVLISNLFRLATGTGRSSWHQPPHSQAPR